MSKAQKITKLHLDQASVYATLTNIKYHNKRFRARVDAALLKEAEKVYINMIPRIPIDTGKLKASAFFGAVNATGLKPGTHHVVVGVKTDYAIYVHERTELKHPNGGEAKFLRNALMAVGPTILGAMLAKLRF